MRLVLGETDLGTVNPKLAAQLVNPEEALTVTANSGKKLRWLCYGTESVPHPRREWQAKVYYRSSGNGCAACSGRAVLVGFNDLGTVNPKLASELVNPEEAQTATANSNKKLMWLCRGTKKTPHPRREWQAKVYDRSSGTGCAVCAGMAVLVGFNDLGTVNPKLASELVNPEEALTVTAFSEKKLVWLCHGTESVPHPRREWDAKVGSRSSGNGCAVCSGKAVLVGFNDLGTVNPKLASQLVNIKEAQTVTLNSGKKLNWYCNGTNSTPHPRREWDATVKDRSNGRGCAGCSGRAVLVGFNDLGTVNPKLASELVNPEEAKTVTVGSTRKLRWLCHGTESVPHPRREWDTAVGNRSRGDGCAVCSGHAVLIGFNDLGTVNPKLASELVNPKEALTVTAFSHKKLAWLCHGTESVPHPRREWYASVAHRSNRRGCSVCAKYGFDPAKPAYLYRFTFRDGGESVQVFGITGDFKNRLQHYKGQITNLTDIESIWFEVGADAQRFESQIMTELAASSATPSNIGVAGTITESFCIDEDGWEFMTVFETLWSAAKTFKNS